MKTIRQLCVASVLAMTFSLPAFAGEMSTTVAPPASPSTTTVTGVMSTTITSDSTATQSEDASALDTVTEAALNVLQSVLSLL